MLTNLQINLVEAIKRLNLSPGRYTIAANFFRDEVGSEDGPKLYIADISPTRTELRLSLVKNDPKTIDDLREFAQPAVPPLDAQALVDETFGVALEGSSVTPAEIETASGVEVTDRLSRSSRDPDFTTFVNAALPRIRAAVLDGIAARNSDLELQADELREIVQASTQAVLIKLVRGGALHPQLQLVDRSGQPVK